MNHLLSSLSSHGRGSLDFFNQKGGGGSTKDHRIASFLLESIGARRYQSQSSMHSAGSRLVVLAAINITATSFSSIRMMRGFSMMVSANKTPAIFPASAKSSPSLSLSPLAWCRTAQINKEDGSVLVESIADGPVTTTDDECTRSIPTSQGIVDSQTFDLTSSVEWMQHIERSEDRIADEGGAGAYDTMRCDILLSKNDDKRVLVWGRDFHLNRLRRSYLSLVDAKADQKVVAPSVRQAVKQSNAILDKLIEEAVSSIELEDAEPMSSRKDIPFQLFRLTLLWSCNKEQKESSNNNDEKDDVIVVRGHATSSCEIMRLHRAHEPIIVSVATHSESASKKGKDIPPTRHQNPHSKVASWCRLRKQMEQPTFKAPDASEVLMVRPRMDEANTQRLEVLEGLSSNFFAIYKDGSLRTATQGVLDGYVRHLVLESASKAGLRFDPRPIYLHEAEQWKECFITSSSRLLWPIANVLIPADGGTSDPSSRTSFVEHWSFDDMGHGNRTPPKSQELLHAILKAGGYDDEEV